MNRRRSKTDGRNFADIRKKSIGNKQLHGANRFSTKRKSCIICKKIFTAEHPRQIYCSGCKK